MKSVSLIVISLLSKVIVIFVNLDKAMLFCVNVDMVESAFNVLVHYKTAIFVTNTSKASNYSIKMTVQHQGPIKTEDNVFQCRLHPMSFSS
mmetsp:Transcript_21092/g.3420  ORF Transcript_21092/g.3420 Transcript_21092/m.3420 type:complete len:91 (+) Transcript_21092:963-1235(+)